MHTKAQDTQVHNQLQKHNVTLVNCKLTNQNLNSGSWRMKGRNSSVAFVGSDSPSSAGNIHTHTHTQCSDHYKTIYWNYIHEFTKYKNTKPRSEWV